MKKNVRTIITMMTMMVSACIIFAACGKVEETHSQVVNTTEKAAATATAESKETEVTVDTTTTTTVTTTAEPETTTEPATAEVVTTIAEPDTDTEAATTASEPETDTDTEATTTEAPADETTVVTMADNPDGMYTVEECFRRKAEEATGKKVVKFDYYKDEIPLVVVFEDESMALLTLPTNEEAYDSTSLYSVDSFAVGEASGFECSVDFMP